MCKKNYCLLNNNQISTKLLTINQQPPNFDIFLNMSNNHPIKSYTGVASVKSLDDIVIINGFVFKIVPIPLYEQMRTNMKNIRVNDLPKYFEVWKSLKPDQNGKHGDWCCFHAKLMVAILKNVYGFKQCNIWGYGLKRIVNHVAVMINWKGNRYNFDPYFGLHYLQPNGDHMTFDHLCSQLRNKNFSEIKLSFADPMIKKNVMTKAGDDQNEHQWTVMSSEGFYKHIINLFKQANSESQLIHQFGNSEHMQLMLLH